MPRNSARCRSVKRGAGSKVTQPITKLDNSVLCAKALVKKLLLASSPKEKGDYYMVLLALHDPEIGQEYEDESGRFLMDRVLSELNNFNIKYFDSVDYFELDPTVFLNNFINNNGDDTEEKLLDNKTLESELRKKLVKTREVSQFIMECAKEYKNASAIRTIILQAKMIAIAHSKELNQAVKWEQFEALQAEMLKMLYDGKLCSDIIQSASGETILNFTSIDKETLAVLDWFRFAVFGYDKKIFNQDGTITKSIFVSSYPAHEKRISDVINDNLNIINKLRKDWLPAIITYIDEMEDTQFQEIHI